MRNLIFRIWVLLAMLGLITPGCIGHDNPFDSKNSKEHDPFEFYAVTDYGKIKLTWKWPTYPAEGGQRINFDRFVLFRQAQNSSKIDTIYPDHPLREDWFDSTKANGIVGDKFYTYRVAGMRGSLLSDSSRTKTALAYPLPLDCAYLGADSTTPLGINFSPPMAAIGFDKDIKFVVENGTVCVVRPIGSKDQLGQCQSIATSPSDLALARKVEGDSIHIIVCSAIRNRVDFLVWTGGNLIWRKMVRSIQAPQALAIEEGSDSVFVADDNLDAIFKINLYTGGYRQTKMRTGLNPWKLLILSNSPRLFCANSGSKNVSVFDIPTESRLDLIPVNEKPIDLWLGPDSMLYVACATGKTVDVINPRTRQKIDEIPIVIPAKPASILFPRSVTGFADPQNRPEHRGVLAVVVCSGDPDCADPAYLLYYSLADYSLTDRKPKLERYLELPKTSNPTRTKFLARMNVQEKGAYRLYILLYNGIWACKLK